MASFTANQFLQRLERSVSDYRRALAQPLLVPVRIVATDASGISTMEVLQKDLPFGSPSFCKTRVFEHPNVSSVEFLTWPTPHFLITGTIDGVLSAMRRRYTYFIKQHAIALFKRESADSLIFIQPRPTEPDHGLSYSDLPDLEPIPTDFETQPCYNCTTFATTDTTTVDPIPTIDFRPYINRPPTPTPMDTLPYIAEDDSDSDDYLNYTRDCATPFYPPTDSPQPELDPIPADVWDDHDDAAFDQACRDLNLPTDRPLNRQEKILLICHRYQLNNQPTDRPTDNEPPEEPDIDEWDIPIALPPSTPQIPPHPPTPPIPPSDAPGPSIPTSPPPLPPGSQTFNNLKQKFLSIFKKF
jgi:hypothetical protein